MKWLKKIINILVKILVKAFRKFDFKNMDIFTKIRILILTPMLILILAIILFPKTVLEIDFLVAFFESDFAEAMQEFQQRRVASRRAFARKYVPPILLLSTIPLWWVFYMRIEAEIEERKFARKIVKGTYRKEHPIDTFVVKNERARNGRAILTITCSIKESLTPNADEYMASKAENKKRKLALHKELLKLIPRDELCLVARSASVYNKRKAGAIKPEEERDRSFRLDLSSSWEKKKNDEWLAEHNAVLNLQGYAIGIRGADEDIAERSYEVFVPDEDIQKVHQMSLDELLKFCEPENCKLQIRENGFTVVCSDSPGYTKQDIMKAIHRASEPFGIKVKTK